MHQLRHRLQEVAPALHRLARRLGGNDDTHRHILRTGPACDAARIGGTLCGHRLEQRTEQTRDGLFGTRGDPEPLRDGASHANHFALLCRSQELAQAYAIRLAGADQLLERLQPRLRHAVCVCRSTAASLRLLEVLVGLGLCAPSSLDAALLGPKFGGCGGLLRGAVVLARFGARLILLERRQLGDDGDDPRLDLGPFAAGRIEAALQPRCFAAVGGELCRGLVEPEPLLRLLRAGPLHLFCQRGETGGDRSGRAPCLLERGDQRGDGGFGNLSDPSLLLLLRHHLRRPLAKFDQRPLGKSKLAP